MTEFEIDHDDFHEWRQSKNRDWPCHLCTLAANEKRTDPAVYEISPQHTRMFGRASKPKPIY